MKLKWPNKKMIDYFLKNKSIDLNVNDINFLNRIFQTSPKIYEKRLEKIGFKNLNNVIDAGCGFGQWSLILSQLNTKVVSIEKDEKRLMFLKFIIEELGISNISLMCELLPISSKFETNSDGIFCYGTLPLLDWRKALEQFSSLLRKGGKLYVNANDIGWYLFTFETGWNSTTDFDSRRSLIKTLLETEFYLRHNMKSSRDSHILITMKELQSELYSLGFTNIRQGIEGSIKDICKPRITKHSLLLGKYKGFDAVHEALGVKA
jgi:precorrin-6B methylase 2